MALILFYPCEVIRAPYGPPIRELRHSVRHRELRSTIASTQGSGILERNQACLSDAAETIPYEFVVHPLETRVSPEYSGAVGPHTKRFHYGSNFPCTIQHRPDIRIVRGIVRVRTRDTGVSPVLNEKSFTCPWAPYGYTQVTYCE